MEMEERCINLQGMVSVRDLAIAKEEEMVSVRISVKFQHVRGKLTSYNLPFKLLQAELDIRDPLFASRARDDNEGISEMPGISAKAMGKRPVTESALEQDTFLV